MFDVVLAMSPFKVHANLLLSSRFPLNHTAHRTTVCHGERYSTSPSSALRPLESPSMARPRHNAPGWLFPMHHVNPSCSVLCRIRPWYCAYVYSLSSSKSQNQVEGRPALEIVLGRRLVVSPVCCQKGHLHWRSRSPPGMTDIMPPYPLTSAFLHRSVAAGPAECPPSLPRALLSW